MTGFSRSGRALALALFLSTVAGCDRNPLAGTGGGSGTAELNPANVSASALRAAVTDDNVRSFYEAGQWQAVWDDDRAAELLEAIDQVAAHGLRRDLFIKGEASDPAAREVQLTKAALGYAKALAMGHVDPKKTVEVYTLARPKVDVAAGLRKALADGNVGQWFASLPPQTPEYRALSEAFVRYAKQAEQEKGGAIAVGDALKPGQSDPRIPRIAEALASNGYLPPAPAPQDGQPQAAPSQRYSPDLVTAVKRLQTDYGMKADGVVGPATLEVLNTSAADRARQLAVNLERLRWLEREPAATRIDVNTAATFLDYWRDGQRRDRRAVVVGQPDWETPQLGSPIYRLVANPTWTVPESIYEDELADKGPGYFAANNMIRKDGRIVQQPGPKNSLGLVKLDMLNDEAIYLHDTPAKALFGQPERHKSHGCVRVHNAVQFARMIAGDEGVLEDFDEALAKGDEAFVDIKRRIPVRLLYHTAYFDGGRVHFRSDAYGWDENVAVGLGLVRRVLPTRRPHERGSDFGP